MITKFSYYNRTPEQREQNRQEFATVIKGLGFRNTNEAASDTMYSEPNLIIEGVNVYVNREPSYYLLSTERYSRSKRDGGKSVKIPVGTLINAPRIKRQIKDIVAIQKQRAAAEAEKLSRKNECQEAAAALSKWLTDSKRGTASASWSDTIEATIDTKNDGEIVCTVDYKTLTVTHVEAKTSFPRLTSYGGNSRKELEDIVTKAQNELKRLEIVENVMSMYRLTLAYAETK